LSSEHLPPTPPPPQKATTAPSAGEGGAGAGGGVVKTGGGGEEGTGGWWLDRLDTRVTNYVYSLFTRDRKPSPPGTTQEAEGGIGGWWLDRADAKVTNYAYSLFTSNRQPALSDEGTSDGDTQQNATKEKTEEVEGWGGWLDRVDTKVTDYVCSFFTSSSGSSGILCSISHVTRVNWSSVTCDSVMNYGTLLVLLWHREWVLWLDYHKWVSLQTDSCRT